MYDISSYLPRFSLAHAEIYPTRLTVISLSRLIISLHIYDDEQCGRESGDSLYMSWVVREAGDSVSLPITLNTSVSHPGTVSP